MTTAQRQDTDEADHILIVEDDRPPRRMGPAAAGPQLGLLRSTPAARTATTRLAQRPRRCGRQSS